MQRGEVKDYSNMSHVQHNVIHNILPITIKIFLNLLLLYFYILETEHMV